MEPLCEYFRKCEGCDTQHIDYAMQLKNKKDNLEIKIKYPDIQVFPSKDYFYRNRLDIIFHKKGVGLRGKGCIIPIEKCVICNEKVNEIIKRLNSFFNDNDLETLKSAIIRTTSKDSAVCFQLNKNSTRIKETMEKIKQFQVDNIIVSYGEETFAIKGGEIIKEKLMGNEFCHNAAGFFQNNTEIAEKMQEYVSKILKKYETKHAHLLDLYGGVGTFGIINSELFRKTTIVESFKQAIDCAKMNIKDSKNAEAFALDSSKIKRLKLTSPLFVITDPPRSGMDQKTVDTIKELKPEVIIYISCNPDKLETDIKKFSKYKIESAALFDMFPQTNHIEAIVELKTA